MSNNRKPAGGAEREFMGESRRILFCSCEPRRGEERCMGWGSSRDAGVIGRDIGLHKKIYSAAGCSRPVLKSVSFSC